MIIWHSSFATLTGYSGSSRALVLGLDTRGVAVRPLYLFDADRVEEEVGGPLPARLRELRRLPVRLDVPQIVYGRGDHFSKNSGRYKIGFTMLETDRLPASWVEQANLMDEIWTPTSWGAEVFRASGVRPPIQVIPLGVDPAIFQPGPPRKRFQDRTIFVSVFEWSRRKGWDVLLHAYRAAFRPDDDVLLLLKIDSREPGINPLQEIAAVLPASAPPVGVFYNQALSGERLSELYRSADCFVLPTRGEGWCMPALEAMACGLPVIVTNWSGPTAFVNESVGYPLPIRGLEPTGLDHPYYRGAQWADPDGDALVELLRRVRRERTEAAAKGRAAAELARAWSWDRALDVIQARIADWPEA
ncbi:MAG: glycosyltransferase family 4 protein [Oscillochloris sp.]|nr:glycosyltransferase family 4 protein [Oscillochloris sp.]